MPASLFHENQDQLNQNIQSSGATLEDNRALQLALELSMLGMIGEEEAQINAVLDAEVARLKKSQNTTECVPVPSSEHVAEIVGRQGCKIKALRAKTNTYIKTPVRGEEPVFVVTGRKEDVNAAKREILSAADHFSQIRALRKNTLAGGPVGTAGSLNGANGPLAGQCTIQVRVPYRVVGLVVGPKGATIKRIQQQTSTYIITPSREKEPIFEVTGMPDNVQCARKEIEAHIAIRTGGVVDSGGGCTGTGEELTDSLSQSDVAQANVASLNAAGLHGGFGSVGSLTGLGSLSSGVNNAPMMVRLQSTNSFVAATVAAKLNELKLEQIAERTKVNSNSAGSQPFSFTGAMGSSSVSGTSSLHKAANTLDAYNPFNVSSRNMLNGQLNGFGGNSGGSSSSSSSISGSTGGSSGSNLISISGQSSAQLMNNAGDLNDMSLTRAKSLLNSASNGAKLADLYGQLLSNGANASMRNVTGHMNTNNTSNGNGQSPLGSSSSSSAQITRSSSPLSNSGPNSGSSSAMPTPGALNGPNGLGAVANGMPSAGPFNGLYERDEGIGESPTFDSIAAANLANLSSNLGLANGASNGASLWPDFTNGANNASNGNVQQASRA